MFIPDAAKYDTLAKFFNPFGARATSWEEFKSLEGKTKYLFPAYWSKLATALGEGTGFASDEKLWNTHIVDTAKALAATGQYTDEFGEDIPAGVSTMILIGQVWAISFDNEPDDIETTPDETLQKMLVHVYTPSSGIVPPAVNDFIFFTKDTSVEKSNVKGYYSKVVMQNDSKDKAELYAVSCETTQSSK